jgi:protein-tyrosine phosphatase
MLGITEVIDDLYISGLESHTSILTKGIRSVINISSECPVQDLGPTVDYQKISIPDLPTTSIQPYFDRLADRIDRNLQQGIKTLVHCYVGRSRSATIILGLFLYSREDCRNFVFFILAYLMKHKQMSLREAFYYLRSRRPIVGPNFGFIKQVINKFLQKLKYLFSLVNCV